MGGPRSRGRGDEFYTLAEDVSRILSPMLPHLHGRRVVCPCDGEDSEWVRFLRRHAVDVDWAAGDFDACDFDAYDVVITNPPFSRTADFVRKCVASTADFVVIIHRMSIDKPFVLDALNARRAELRYGPGEFRRPSGRRRRVGSAVLSTVPFGCEREPARRAADKFDVLPDGRRLYDASPSVPDVFAGEVLVPVTFLLTARFDPSVYEVVGVSKDITGADGRRRFDRLRIRMRPDGRVDGRVDGQTDGRVSGQA